MQDARAILSRCIAAYARCETYAGEGTTHEGLRVGSRSIPHPSRFETRSRSTRGDQANDVIAAELDRARVVVLRELDGSRADDDP